MVSTETYPQAILIAKRRGDGPVVGNQEVDAHPLAHRLQESPGWNADRGEGWPARPGRLQLPCPRRLEVCRRAVHRPCCGSTPGQPPRRSRRSGSASCATNAPLRTIVRVMRRPLSRIPALRGIGTSMHGRRARQGGARARPSPGGGGMRWARRARSRAQRRRSGAASRRAPTRRGSGEAARAASTAAVTGAAPS